MLRDEGGDAAYDQIRAWFQIEYICRHHADQLTAALTSLASAWPPAKGNAAEHFQQYVRTLIANLTATSNAANANGRALANYHGDLMETRRKVSDLVDKYPERAAGLAASGIVARRDQLAADARTVMDAADKSAQLLAHLMKPPPVYLAAVVRYKGEPPDETPDAGTSGTPRSSGQSFSPGLTTTLGGLSGSGTGAGSRAPTLEGGVDPTSVPGQGAPNAGLPNTGGSGPDLVVGQPLGAGTDVGAPVGRVIGEPLEVHPPLQYGPGPPVRLPGRPVMVPALVGCSARR
ncbi:WXG100 family type VII secretion target [Luedemannella flava]